MTKNPSMWQSSKTSDADGKSNPFDNISTYHPSSLCLSIEALSFFSFSFLFWDKALECSLIFDKQVKPKWGQIKSIVKCKIWNPNTSEHSLAAALNSFNLSLHAALLRLLVTLKNFPIFFCSSLKMLSNSTYFTTCRNKQVANEHKILVTWNLSRSQINATSSSFWNWNN